VGRKSIPGRPIIYGTTKKFLEVFDLKDLSSLPNLKEIEDFGDEEEA
jgi:segregation and condensation protein B